MKKIFLIPVLIALIFANCRPTQTGDLIITNVTVIHVEDGTLSYGQDVLIENGLIKEILPSGQSTLDTPTLIDGSGKYLIPGLWDMHTHTKTKQPILAMYAIHGITGVRDCGGSYPDEVSQWQKDIAAGEIAGPEMLVAAAISEYVTDSTDIDSLVLSTKEEGYDFVKVYHNLTMEQLREIAQAANKYNISFSGHLPRKFPMFETITEASNMGLSCLEHGFMLSSSVYTGEKMGNPGLLTAARENGNLDGNIDNKKLEELGRILVKNNTWITPTLSVWWGMGIMDQQPDSALMSWYQQQPGVQEAWEANPFKSPKPTEHSPADFEASRNAAVELSKLFKRMKDQGVSIMAGTDSPVIGIIPGYALHKELQLMVEGGFSNLEALQAATIKPADYLNRSDIGSIGRGKQADLVILNSNPLEDIANTLQIDGVVLNGRYLDKKQLNEELIKAIEYDRNQDVPFVEVLKGMVASR